MTNLIQKETEMKDLNQEKSFGSTEGAEKDPDTMLSMIVLLLTCLALAALVHVFV
jgi:hypothetical protein